MDHFATPAKTGSAFGSALLGVIGVVCPELTSIMYMYDSFVEMYSSATTLVSSGDQSATIHSPETPLSRRWKWASAGAAKYRSMSRPLRALLLQARSSPDGDQLG